MMMNNGFNPYMNQQFNAGAFPQQMAGFPQMQMNQGFPNQFNPGMMQMNPGMMNPAMMANQMNMSPGLPMGGGLNQGAYMQQGYNPQMMMNGGFPQGMNNMQQQAKPNNFF